MRMRKRIGRILLAAVCMAAMLYCDSMTGKAFWVEVTGDNTNLRSTAGTEGSIVDTANKGDRFDVASETTGSDGSTWYQVSLANQTCYIHADVVKKVEEAAEGAGAAQPVPATSSSSITPMAAQSATVQKDSVNVRSSADTKADKVATVDSGIAVTVTGTSIDNDGKTWYQVNFINNGSDVTGFIREDMIELGEVMEPVPEEGAAEGTGEGEEPASPEDEAPAEDSSNDTAAYELAYTADKEGVDCWYINDYASGKRYKVEQLLQAEEYYTGSLEEMEKKSNMMRIAIVVLAVLFVVAAGLAAFLGYRYHELSGDDDDEDDDDDDVREAAPVRRRTSAPPTGQRRTRMTSQSNAGGTPRRPAEGERRRPVSEGEPVRRRPVEGERRRPVSEGEPVRRRPVEGERRRPASEGEPVRRRPAEAGTGGQRRPAGASQAASGPRSTRPQETGRTPAAGKPQPSRSSRTDVEWKSKNFLAGDDDEPDFSFINMNDENE